MGFKHTYCKSCGKKIMFIKMAETGKKMPVDEVPVLLYVPERHADPLKGEIKSYITEEGRTVKGIDIITLFDDHKSDFLEYSNNGETVTINFDEGGYVPHWTTCDNPNRFHKKTSKERD